MSKFDQLKEIVKTNTLNLAEEDYNRRYETAKYEPYYSPWHNCKAHYGLNFPEAEFLFHPETPTEYKLKIISSLEKGKRLLCKKGAIQEQLDEKGILTGLFRYQHNIIEDFLSDNNEKRLLGYIYENDRGLWKEANNMASLDCCYRGLQLPKYKVWSEARKNNNLSYTEAELLFKGSSTGEIMNLTLEALKSGRRIEIKKNSFNIEEGVIKTHFSNNIPIISEFLNSENKWLIQKY